MKLSHAANSIGVLHFTKTNKMKQVQEKYVSFELAKLAKAKGVKCHADRFYPDLTWNSNELFICENVGYSNVEQTLKDGAGFGDIIPVYTQSLLRDWIEENSDMVLNVVPYGYSVLHSTFHGQWSNSIHDKQGNHIEGYVNFQTRQEAMDDLLLNALKRM